MKGLGQDQEPESGPIRPASPPWRSWTGPWIVGLLHPGVAWNPGTSEAPQAIGRPRTFSVESSSWAAGEWSEGDREVDAGHAALEDRSVSHHLVTTRGGRAAGDWLSDRFRDALGGLGIDRDGWILSLFFVLEAVLHGQQIHCNIVCIDIRFITYYSIPNALQFFSF